MVIGYHYHGSNTVTGIGNGQVAGKCVVQQKHSTVPVAHINVCVQLLIISLNLQSYNALNAMNVSIARLDTASYAVDNTICIYRLLLANQNMIHTN